MNSIVAAVLFVGVCSSFAFAAPTEKPKIPEARLLNYKYEVLLNGEFNLIYELDDGTLQTREGRLVLNEKKDGYVLVQKGTYTYTSPEGVRVRMSYVADQDGFKIIEYAMPYNGVSAVPTVDKLKYDS
ncbi:Insect cuticle protein [Cinara cedri]|uniref:Insect cuticle protein n=1 Tax=Cinara cedri TaxID=506608 RepID=A0A5E4NDB6_9HEMI|nr:Insect cuticle protein [Cinara cedri]